MICVDASVVAKWLLVEDGTEEARAMYRSMLQSGESVVAPSLLLYEVTNILRQRMRAPEGPSLDEAATLLDDFLAFPITIHQAADLHRDALRLAAAYDLPAAYDAHYLALAEQLRCPFWTADQRLLRRIGDSLPYVRARGDDAE